MWHDNLSDTGDCLTFKFIIVLLFIFVADMKIFENQLSFAVLQNNSNIKYIIRNDFNVAILLVILLYKILLCKLLFENTMKYIILIQIILFSYNFLIARLLSLVSSILTKLLYLINQYY